MDLETLDTVPGAQVLTIGGVKFDPFSTAAPFQEFYYRFDIDEQAALGRSQSDSTLDWWGNQSAEAMEEAFHPERTDCRTILRALKKWYVGCDEMWSQGSFDTNIMENMCRQFDEPIPWPHWCVGDSRAFIRRMEKDPRKEIDFTAHHALEDAKAQVTALRMTLAHFGMKK